MATKKSVSLSVGRGEKLPVSKGAGLTAKGRAKYNAATGSNLKAPAPNPKTEADKGRKASFCARMGGVAAKAKDGERVLHSERTFTSYARSFELPTEVTDQGAQASFENGVLTLALPKRVAVTSKRLEIR